MELEGVPVVVVGLARSGIAAASFLARHGARVVATDRKPEKDCPQEVLSRLAREGVTLELGRHGIESFRAARTVVVSPGVPATLPELAEARAAGAEVIGEMELAFRHLKGRVAAITGTKGKSTTTAALGAMLKETGRDVRVGGNIGDPAIGMVEGSTDDTLFVFEVSSFQLETTDTFHPHVAVFLNLSADHLDRHASFQEYAEAKARIFRRQDADDWAIVNADDPRVLALASRTRARRLRFRAEGDGPADALFTNGHAVLRREGAEEALFERGDVRLPGAHLAIDLLAAATAARVLGASGAEIRRAVQGYTGVEHVLEHVADVQGVRFFNDSKATNVDAARHSLDAFQTPVLAILGGRYKGGDFADLAPALRARGRAVLAIGEATDKVEAALREVVPVVRCASMAEAVAQGFARAEAGDTVLLAPACASFDMFRDYAERGRAFKAEVHALAARVDGRSPGGELQ
ncbi:MAG TPA: UDP-N-acetylmuramoyl-L-alanine--D-glutamate ligase [Vicinamibacteria bacterium]|nr:UDP-N-acetylmuramoyl-L-alanine--D-glutamate ligase [Vicinamibacteria bacterium]